MHTIHTLYVLLYLLPVNCIFSWESTQCQIASRDGVIKSKNFPLYWPFVRGIHRSPGNSPHKGQWRGTLMFFLSAPDKNKQLSKQSRRWWFETPSCSFWRHSNTFTTNAFWCTRINKMPNMTGGISYRMNSIAYRFRLHVTTWLYRFGINGRIHLRVQLT